MACSRVAQLEVALDGLVGCWPDGTLEVDMCVVLVHPQKKLKTPGCLWMRHTSAQCWATENPYFPRVCPFHRVTLANPWAISSISISSGDGFKISRRRPLNIRCQARGSGTRYLFFMSLSDCFGIFLTSGTWREACSPFIYRH